MNTLKTLTDTQVSLIVVVAATVVSAICGGLAGMLLAVVLP